MSKNGYRDDLTRVNQAKSCGRGCLAEAVKKQYAASRFSLDVAFLMKRKALPERIKNLGSKSSGKDFLVDSKGLEPLTFRTSSGSSTS